MKHKAQDCLASLCANCNRDHHTLICPNERTEWKLRKIKGEDDDDDDSKDKDYYSDSFFLMKINNLISVTKNLSTMMEMIFKITVKMRTTIKKIKITMEIPLRMKELKELCL